MTNLIAKRYSALKNLGNQVGLEHLLLLSSLGQGGVCKGPAVMPLAVLQLGHHGLEGQGFAFGDRFSTVKVRPLGVAAGGGLPSGVPLVEVAERGEE